MQSPKILFEPRHFGEHRLKPAEDVVVQHQEVLRAASDTVEQHQCFELPIERSAQPWVRRNPEREPCPTELESSINDVDVGHDERTVALRR